MFPIYIRNTAYLISKWGVTTATLGGSKLKRREWSSPISNKSLPRKRTGQLITGELIAGFLAAEKPLRAEGLCWSPLRNAIPFLPSLAFGTFVNLSLTSLEISSSFYFEFLKIFLFLDPKSHPLANVLSETNRIL